MCLFGRLYITQLSRIKLKPSSKAPRSLVRAKTLQKVTNVNVITCLRELSLVNSFLVVSQVVGDMSCDSGTLLRLRGPLELKCQLDSTDGRFMDDKLQYI